MKEFSVTEKAIKKPPGYIIVTSTYYTTLTKGLKINTRSSNTNAYRMMNSYLVQIVC